MDTLIIARYPFLEESKEIASRYDVDIEKLISSDIFSDARKRGVERILDAIKNSEVSYSPLINDDAQIMEILSYPYARIIVSAINERFLTKRYALAESVRMTKLLNQEAPTVISDLAKSLEVKTTLEDDKLKMHFSDFLRFSSRINSPEWKLVNHEVVGGYVYLAQEKFNRLLQNALQDRIESELPIGVPEDIIQATSEDIRRVSRALEEEKSKFSPKFSGKLEDSDLPPCIRTLLANAHNGMNLSHSGRFAVVSFLRSIGMDTEQILAVFSESPDFDRDKSAYQIKHITGELNGTEGYAAPGCGAMKTNGLCPDPDDLCINRKISHPLNYYRLKTIKKK